MAKTGSAKPLWVQKGYTSLQKYQASRRRYDFKYLYGITPEQYQERLETQQGRCAICGRLPAEAKESVLFVDHCHNSSEVRGLLCRYCNAGLGQFQDNIQRLKSAIKYLTKAVRSTILKRRGKRGHGKK